ncbi:DNA-directed RNA polymerase sigma subunit [Clostridium sp. SY8519]|uniref:sigma factor n=1 Tax=Clostridium sp. (strain SY8519) TaxID=1042156 RepID=UPI0002171D81|nr:sigma factor [Clostridium sp. SY8519]BAK47702.1 DNA-directed RNA polymerase sigma subunit [Clostridium sp. SY8519]
MSDKEKSLETLSDSVYYKEYLGEARAADTLSAGELNVLYEMLPSRDPAVTDRIVNGWLMRIIAMAAEESEAPVPADDLIQEGNMALWTGLAQIDHPMPGTEVDELLKQTVQNAMRDYIRMETGHKSQEEAAVGKVALVRQAQEYLAETNGEVPDLKTLSEFTKLSEAEITDVLALLKE